MKLLTAVLVLLPLALSLQSVDIARIASSFNGPLDSLKSAYQVTVARSILNQPLLDSSCEYVAQNAKLTLDDLYYASHISKIQGCQINIAGIEEFLRSEITTEGAKVKVLFKASVALSNFDLQLDASLYEAISVALKTEDTVMAHSLAYLATSLVPGEAPKDLVDSIEDVAHRADTIGNYMSFDGGLMETAMFLKGAFSLSQKAGKSALAEEIVKKFANYIISNKDKSGQSNLFYTMIGLDALANNNLMVPTHVIVLDNSAVLTKESPTLKVALVDPLGKPVGGSSISVKSAASPLTGNAVFTPGKMTGKDGVYEVAAEALARGVYPVDLMTHVPAGYIDPDVSKVTVKVVLPVNFKDALFKLIDIDDNRVISSSDLSTGPVAVKGDLSTRMILDFHLQEESGSSVALHQVFVRFTNSKTKQDVYFIAQADLNRKYTVDLNFRTASSKSFGSLAGDYEVVVLVGDATLAKALTFNIATFTLELPESKEPVQDVSKAPKPEISHVFRVQETRPPQVVSMFFTGLIVLPAVILLAVWLKLGANISNMTPSLSALLFHGGLLAIFAIYLNFFLGTNMFTTMKCLAGVAVVTFLGGQRLLSSIAAQKKAK